MSELQEKVLHKWRRNKLDTMDIAEELQLPESVVYRLLHAPRSIESQVRQCPPQS